MKLKVTVLVLTILIFFIRIFYKESTNLIEMNFNHFFGVSFDRVVIYVYQIFVFLFITSVKKINIIIVLTLLLINLFLIICYTIPLSNLG
ncbi:hypothetical protein ACM46_16955 [Chryseobacterium angstadtii]|uniref:Uncharacterized protein n=1 Tax=Chryseobacterium angstadtii TaxID=558151 RepID=A0A0J7I0J0_9FLAO|nr:hypothetical protein ACM46_16955 [Chryseobacterium angstadtii]